MEVSEKDIETLREAVDGCGGPSYTQAIAILDRLSPPAPEVDEATVWTDKVVAVLNATLPMGDTRSQEDLARTVIAELIASKDAEIERLCDDVNKYQLMVIEWQNKAAAAQTKQGDTLAELAALRAENERLKDTIADLGVDLDEWQRCERAAGNIPSPKAAERNTAEPAKETTVSYDPNYKCPSCGVAIGMLHEPDCALMLSRTAESAKTHVWPATHDDACSEIKGAETTPEVVVTQGDRSASENPPGFSFQRCMAEAEARGRREAVKGISEDTKQWVTRERENARKLFKPSAEAGNGHLHFAAHAAFSALDELKRMITEPKP